MKPFTRSLSILIPIAIATAILCMPRPASASVYQSLGVPAYFYPSGTTNLDLFDDLNAGFPTVNYMIAEAPYTGVSADPNYLSVIEAAQDAGVTVLGYVPTDEGLTSLSTVEGYVHKEMNWYDVDGIFFDQANCTTGNETYYTSLKTYTKGFFSSAIVALNQGGQITDSNYASIADILVTFEGSYTAYDDAYTATQGTPLGGASDLYFSNYAGETWYSSYSNQKFWNIVYACPSADLSNALTLSESRNAGVVYITDEVDGTILDPAGTPAPGYTAVNVPYCYYNTLPTYLSTELTAVAAY